MKASKLALSTLALVTVAIFLSDSHSRRVESQTSTTLWSKQLGTPLDDAAGCVVTDHQGGVVVAGGTKGNLFTTNAGGDDVYIVKYNANGNQLWAKQFGTSKDDDPTQVTIDSQNNIIVVGNTGGILFGPFTGPQGDAFIVKYDSNGNQLWAKQYGTGDSSNCSVAVDRQNNLYCAGITTGNLFGPNADSNDPGAYDSFIIKYDPSGNKLWAKQFGATGDDIAAHIALDAQGNAYVAGGTNQLFSTSTGYDSAFLAKFDPNGVLLWGKQFGSSYKSFATGLCVDGTGYPYVSGYTANDGSGSGLNDSGFITKYGPSGNTIWSKQLIAANGVTPTSVYPNIAGNVVVAGRTQGNLFAPISGSQNIFAVKYDTNGITLWNIEYGTTTDNVNDLFVDNQGYVYIAGDTQGNLFGANAGGDDAFIQKLSPTGQMASAKVSHPTPYKPLLFAWSGQRLALSYPPMLANKLPYVYAGYLCSGIPGAKVSRTAKKQMVIQGRGKQVVINPNSLIYQINGKSRKMSAKPVMVGTECYVPLDVMKAVLPYPVHFDG